MSYTYDRRANTLNRPYADDFSDEELATMSIFDMMKPFARAEYMERAGLGAYSPENPNVRALIHRHLLRVQGNGAMMFDKNKAKAIMAQHEVPEKYKRYLSNWSMQFMIEGRPPVGRWV
jgi:hypothetical protein